MTAGAALERRFGPEELHQRAHVASWLAGVLGAPGPPGQVPEPQGELDLDGALRDAATLLRLATSEDLRSWESDRVRLFVNAPGGIAVPLQASWWIDGAIGGPTTAAAAAFHLEEGLRATPEAGPADSLPTQLELAHVLLQHQRAAVLTGQQSLEEHARGREVELLERFLLPWVPEACSAGRRAARCGWWRGVLDLLDAFVSGEARRLVAALPGPASRPAPPVVSSER